MTKSFQEPVFLVRTEFRLNERLANRAREIARTVVDARRTPNKCDCPSCPMHGDGIRVASAWAPPADFGGERRK